MFSKQPAPTEDDKLSELIEQLKTNGKMDIALAVQIATYMNSSMRATLENYSNVVKNEIFELRNEFRQANVGNLRRIIALEENFENLRNDFQHQRQERADKDLAEAEFRFKNAQSIREGLDTEERIEVKKEITQQLDEVEKKKQEDAKAVWKQRWNAVLTAVMVSSAIALVSAVISIIGWILISYARAKGII